MKENCIGYKLEKTICDKFSSAGWDVNSNPKPISIDNTSRFMPDLELLFEGKSFGYVEVMSNNNPELFVKKAISIRNLFLNLKNKPLLMVVTDGVEYHVSSNGGSFETIHFVPKPQGYHVLVALINSYVDYANNGRIK